MGCDLLVIGGGLVGAAVAWGAARAGATVVLLDEGDVALRAARGNFGLVWVQSKGDGRPAYARWTRQSATLWPRLADGLAEATGIDCHLRQAGGLNFCLSEAEMEERAALIARMDSQTGSIGTRLVERAELRRMVPAIGDRVAGASFCPADGDANPLRTLHALLAGMVAAGGRYLANRGVDALAPAGNGFVAQAGSERFAADKVLVAAGLGSRVLAPMLGLDMPVRPVRGQIAVTERVRRFLDYTTHTLRQAEEGSVLMGDSQEEAGLDTTATVPVVQAIAARNLALFPCLRDAAVVRMWAALRVMTPDGLPIYQQSERHPGAFAATCHSGVTLAGSHALALAPAILAGGLPDDLEEFHARRFQLLAA